MLRLDNLERKREMRYRHPHCIVVLLLSRWEHRAEKRRSRELCRKHPCTDIWTNRKRFDSNSWCCDILYVCVVECYAHECFTLSVMHFLFMLCMYDFFLNVWNMRESKRNEFRLFFCQSGISCKECNWIVCKEYIDKRFRGLSLKAQIG